MKLPNVNSVIDIASKILNDMEVTEPEIQGACQACGQQINCEECHLGIYYSNKFDKWKDSNNYSTNIERGNDGKYRYTGRERSD